MRFHYKQRVTCTFYTTYTVWKTHFHCKRIAQSVEEGIVVWTFSPVLAANYETCITWYIKNELSEVFLVLCF